MTDNIDEKKYQEDEKFIRDLFENDGMKIPESLSVASVKGKLADDVGSTSEAVIKDKLADDASTSEASINDKPADDAGHEAPAPVKVNPAKKAAKKRIWMKPLGLIAAVAACFILVFNPFLKSKTVDAETLDQFTSYKAINETIEEIAGSNKMLYSVEGDMAINGEVGEADSATSESGESKSYSAAVPNAKSGKIAAKAPDASASSDSASSDSESKHSDTYLQVEGVDEADVVKVDNDHIYFIDSNGSRIYIYRAVSGEAVKESVIKAGAEEYFCDIFLSGDRLVVVSEDFDNRKITGQRSNITVYDISDRKSPEKVSQYAQSGYPVSQRMVGDIVYLVSDKYAVRNDFPVCGMPEREKKLAPSDISCIPRPLTAEYTIIGAVDTSTGKELSHVTKAILGGSQDIYANGENLYIAGRTYIEKERKEEPENEFVWDFGNREFRTCIIKVRMSDGDLKVLSTATVPGEIDDQFSMDEKDGNFRIATTTRRWNEEGESDDINNLFVLNKNLKELGSVTGFARGESIKAVKYIGDTAYVITYEETDPLFVIDLSNSRKPKIMGEVKISGFSTLLLPVSDDKLLGIGYSTSEVEDIDMEATSGLKFALFDVSDPARPKVINSKAFENVYSEVQEDHRALTVLGDGRFIVPCSVDHYRKVLYEDEFDDEFDEDPVNIEEDEVAEDEDEVAGDEDETEDAESEGDEDEYYDEYVGTSGIGYVISTSGNDIDVDDSFKTKNGMTRCPVIDGYIYAICENDKVVSHKLK